MKKRLNRQKGWHRALGVLTLVGLTGAGCQSLDVPNLLEPDRARAAANPSDVEALIGGSFFPNWWEVVHGSNGGLNGVMYTLLGYGASDFTATMQGGTSSVWMLETREPRPSHENAATICSTICQWGPRDFWQRIGRASSLPFDGLQIINDGMTFEDLDGNDTTPRARAFAKLMQGLSWGYSALIYDQVNIVPETIDLNSVDITELNISSLTPYGEAMDAAIASIEEAIQIAQQNPDVVQFPDFNDALWFQTAVPVSNEQFIRFANTMAARLLVLNARTPQERENVDWQKVLQFTANGLTEDFDFQLASNRSSQVISRASSNSAAGLYNGRWDYRTVGMADQSGNYQDWINGPLEDRFRFDMTTPDRRITGATPTSHGSYTCYYTHNNGFLEERGRYAFSAYGWRRHTLEEGGNCTSTASSFNAGTWPVARADENNLLRAEALLRTGNVPAAVDLINITRTREQTTPDGVTHPGLPPLPASGQVPTVNGQCVPRTDAGACGTVWTALRYERMIELAGIDLARGWADSRGFGMLPDFSPYHYPIPGNVLQLYGLPGYTYGGEGGDAIASYNPTN